MARNNFKEGPKNATMVLKYSNPGVTSRGETYDPTDLTDILSVMQKNGITKLISIPVYTERELMKFDGDTKTLKGVMPVGYISDINVDEGKIVTVIYSTFIDRINSFVDPVIKFRVIVDTRNNYLKQIIALDILPSNEEVKESNSSEVVTTAKA